MPLANRQYSAVLLPLLVLVASAMALGLSASRGGFFDTTDNAGSYFDAAACTPGTSTYDFTGVTSPSSTHVALDGEIDETDAVIENGTFGARRDTITGWANWGEATSGEYSNLVTSDNLYYQGLDPGSDDNAAMLFELTAGEDPSCVARIDVTVEGAQGGSPGSDLLFVYLWDYNTGSYLVGGSMNGTTDQVVSFSVTANPGDYVQAADGQMTVFVVNEDTSDWIRIDRITVDVVVDASADLTGTLVPSALEGEIVAGGETLIITLTNDTWDLTVGADNAITTALINGIDSAQSEATGWDAVVKAGLTFNEVTRTSPFVVTVTLGAEPTYQITGRETITVTVPASAVAGGGLIVATPTFRVDAACTPGTSTYDFTGVTSSTHVALDGEIVQTDIVIENGTFGARRDTIGGWANWGEATSGEYSNLVTSDNLYYQGLDPGSDDNAAMLFELTAGEDPSCVARIDVTVEGAQGGSPGSDLLFVYLWDYNTGSYLVGGSMNGTTDQVVSFSVTANPGDYVQAADGQMTVFVVNEDTSDWIRIDRITVDVVVDASADLTGTLVPSALEGEIVAGGETLIITLTNDTWDLTVGADNAITTALINGIDSAQSEATGWDAVVKAGLTFNEVTRTSNTVVTITLPAFATYNVTATETIEVTVPATAVTGGGAITATPTFDVTTASAALTGTLVPSVIEGDIVTGAETLIITLTGDTWDSTVGGNNAITTALINGIDSAQAEGTGWDAVVKAGLTFNEVVRTSNTVVTVTLPAFATYNVTADETIEVTVPATAVTGGGAITATPTFDVTTASAALTGTLVPSVIEGDIVTGAETLIITLTGDTWDSTVGGNNAITTALINGIDSAQAEGTGWDAVVKAGLTFNEVVRTSNTVVTVTLPAFATYNVTADETIEVTVPATAVTGNAIVAAPTFNVITRFSAALTSVADTHGEENDADKNFGTGVEMRVQSKAGGTNHRSFGRFDVSSIPAGSTIGSATLTLCATVFPASTRTYDVHRMTASWVETTLTWNNQPGVAAAATDSVTTPASETGCMTWTVTADVQAWVDGTANNGWRVADSVEEGSDYLTKFHTRENGESAQRPKLDVVYFAP